MMKTRHIELIGHSLGINVYHAVRSSKQSDRKLPKEFCRNYFAASEGHTDYKDLCEIEGDGFMERYTRFNNLYFGVTEQGIEKFKAAFIELMRPTDF